MQCKSVQQKSPFSTDDSDVTYTSSSPFHQSSNILLPHQVGSVDSTCSSWPGHVWRSEPPSSKYWLDSDLNNNKNNNSNNGFPYGRERVSVSSVSSDISDISIATDDFCMSSDVDESYNSDSSTSSEASSAAGREVKQALPLTAYMHEDPNNNNSNRFEQLSNTNTNSEYNANASTGATKNANKNTKSPDKAKARLFDDEGYIRRAACVCLDETESKVLLVSSKKDPCSWLVPGGGMEAGEEMATAAVREAWEEAGVQGHITKYLGLFETNHQNGHKKHRTAVFVVSVKEVLADYPEAYLGRVRQWFTLEEALLHLARTRPLQSAYLQLLLVSRLKVTSTS